MTEPQSAGASGIDPARVPVPQLRRYAAALLTVRGVTEHIARDVAEVLVAAEARGFASHGLIRLGRIITGLAAGTHNPAAEPSFDDGGIVLRVDGGFGLGHHAGKVIMRRLMNKAREHGIAIATARRMTHFGFGGFYAEMAAAVGLVGLVLCNTEPAAAPFAGRGKVLGTNPISFACASREHGILTVDMATTASARGRLLAAQRKGEPLPADIAVDADGRPTLDPTAGLAGALLPLGGAFGYKGTGLAVLVDVLTGALASAETGSRVRGTVTTTDPISAGYLFLVLNPAFFGGQDAFQARVDALAADLLAAGEDVLLPGAKEHAAQATAEREGVALSPGLLSDLRAWGAEYGLTLG